MKGGRLKIAPAGRETSKKVARLYGSKLVFICNLKFRIIQKSTGDTLPTLHIDAADQSSQTPDSLLPVIVTAPFYWRTSLAVVKSEKLSSATAW